jgi:signal transduction histidine kinase
MQSPFGWPEPDRRSGGRIIFRWPAIAGRFATHVISSTPREFSPCGVVVDANAVQLFSRPGRHYSYLDEVTPRIIEALLQPFSVGGRPIGTIWVMAHDEQRKFGAEDARARSGVWRLLHRMPFKCRPRCVRRVTRTEKDEFLALLSHEMRNPLHAASAWNALLKDQHRNGASGRRFNPGSRRRDANATGLSVSAKEIPRSRGNIAASDWDSPLPGISSSFTVERSRRIAMAQGRGQRFARNCGEASRGDDFALHCLCCALERCPLPRSSTSTFTFFLPKRFASASEAM